MQAFWGWMDNGGPQNFLAGVHSNLELDAGHMLLVGESAGKGPSISVHSVHIDMGQMLTNNRGLSCSPVGAEPIRAAKSPADFISHAGYAIGLLL